MKTQLRITAVMAMALAGGLLAANQAQAGVRGTVSVSNQSPTPYHIFVENQRVGTVLPNRTLNVRVNDWSGPTKLQAIQAGPYARGGFTRYVETCQLAKWDLHIGWESLRTLGGPTPHGPHGPGMVHPVPPPPPMHGHHGPHGPYGPHGPPNTGVQLVGQGIGMIAHGAERNQHGGRGGAEIAAGILTIIAGATHNR